MDQVLDYDSLAIFKDLAPLREAIPRGQYCSHTAGQSARQSGHYARSLCTGFLRFCQRNPKPRPLTGVSDTGNPKLYTLGRDIDIRTDVPAYNIYRYGLLVQLVTDNEFHWQDDLLICALGCLFTFENALQQAGKRYALFV